MTEIAQTLHSLSPSIMAQATRAIEQPLRLAGSGRDLR
jgi:hypothetical protein